MPLEIMSQVLKTTESLLTVLAGTQLGYITLARSMMQALASPLGGFLGTPPYKTCLQADHCGHPVRVLHKTSRSWRYAAPVEQGCEGGAKTAVRTLESSAGCVASAGHYYNRAWVISGGCLIWGVVTVGFSMARTLREGIFFWAFNGLGLALVWPQGYLLVQHACAFSTPERSGCIQQHFLRGALLALVQCRHHEHATECLRLATDIKRLARGHTMCASCGKCSPAW